MKFVFETYSIKHFQRTLGRFQATHTHAYDNPCVKTMPKVLHQLPLKLEKQGKITHPTENLRENFAQKSCKKFENFFFENFSIKHFQRTFGRHTDTRIVH